MGNIHGGAVNKQTETKAKTGIFSTFQNNTKQIQVVLWKLQNNTILQSQWTFENSTMAIHMYLWTFENTNQLHTIKFTCFREFFLFRYSRKFAISRIDKPLWNLCVNFMEKAKKEIYEQYRTWLCNPKYDDPVRELWTHEYFFKKIREIKNKKNGETKHSQWRLRYTHEVSYYQ